MRGHIRRRGRESWQIVVYAGRNAETGKKRWYLETVRGLRRDADARLSAILAEGDPYNLATARGLTLGRYLDRWLHDYAMYRLSPKTYERYAEMVEKRLKPYLGTVPLGGRGLRNRAGPFPPGTATPWVGRNPCGTGLSRS